MLVRRDFLNALAAGCLAPRLDWGAVLAAVKHGRLGAIRFCRASGAEGLELVQEMLGEHAPISASVYGKRAILRYRDCVVSYREDRGDPVAVFHGTKATLSISEDGHTLYPGANS